MTTLAQLFSLAARGTLTFQPSDPPRPTGRYVIQRVAPGLGNVAADPERSLQIRAHVIPADPQTPRQLAARARFAAGVIAWHELPPTDRAYWYDQGPRHGLPAFNAFLSYYLRTHPLTHYPPLRITGLVGSADSTPGNVAPGSFPRTL